MSAAIFLVNPKYSANVGGVIRAAANLGGEQVWWSGDRIDQGARLRGDTVSPQKWRLPREERVRDYERVKWGRMDEALDRLMLADYVPVCVELVPGAERLPLFDHPERAVYVFGPEDGSVPKGTRHACHRFVVIPSRWCLNLAAAVNIVLYDRQAKLGTGVEPKTHLPIGVAL